MRPAFAAAALLVVGGSLTACAVVREPEPGVAAAAPPVAVGPEMVGGVLYERGPSSFDLARYYPAGAREQDVSGRAELSCRISGGRLADCVVVAEDPPGMGFGLAAMRASANLVPASRGSSGASQEGASVRLPFFWSSSP